jgi:hypothetical protein
MSAGTAVVAKYSFRARFQGPIVEATADPDRTNTRRPTGRESGGGRANAFSSGLVHGQLG